jgi:cytochrome b
VRAWDAPTRLAHWSLASLVVFEWIRDDGGPVHRVAGYVAAGVVLVRWCWALVQPRGLAGLRPSPAATIAYLRELRRGRAPRHAGHDPLGVWMVWLLWILVLLLALTGWVSRWDAFWGDERVTDLHARMAEVLMAAAAVHVIAVGVMSWVWRENLPKAMLTGCKRAVEPDDSR